MTQYVINIGALPNDGTGDPLRTAFNEVNLNFDQVFAAGPVLSNVRIANNTILTTNTNGNLVLNPNGIGVVQANAHILPDQTRIRNLGSSTNKWNNIYSQYVTISGDATVGGNLSVIGNIVQIGNIVTDAKTIQLANTAGTANAANGSGITVGANDNIATFLFNSSNNAWATNIGLQVNGGITGTSIAVSDATVYGNVNAINANLTGNIGAGNILTGGVVSAAGNVRGANFNTVGQVSAAGNITGNYIFGNAAFMTGLPTPYANANVVAYGQAGWAGNIVPSASNTYSLGNSTNWWSNVWVAGNTMYIGGVPIGMGAGNTLTVAGNSVVTVSNDTTANLANISIDNNNIFNNQGQGVVISNFSFIAEAETAYVQIPAGNSASDLSVVQEQGNVRIAANTASWTFDTTGNITLPGNTSSINYANGAPYGGGGGGGPVSQLTNGDNSFALDADGNVIFQGADPGQGINRGMEWDYGANANGVNSQVRQDNAGLTVQAWTEGSGYAAPVNIVTNQDANVNTWIFTGNGELALAGNLVVPVDGGIRTTTISPAFTSNITGITTGNPTVIVTIADEIFDGPFSGTVDISGVVGTFEADGVWGYQATDFDQFQLFTDATLTTPVDGTLWTAYVSGGVAVGVGSYENLSIQGGNISISSNDNTWIFDTTGNLTIPNDIVSNTTIEIDNRASGNSADIRLFSADDITLQARDRTLGSGSEGGDINIYAGDSAEDGDASGGDVQIFAGNGGAGNVDYGGTGGFITIRSGDGGPAIGNSGGTAESGGSLTLQAGSAGDAGGNIDLGAGAGDVYIYSGAATGNNRSGGNITLSTGTGGANNAGGNVQIAIPGGDTGSGGTWTFDATGNLILPQNGNITSVDGWAVRFQATNNGLVQSGITLDPNDGIVRLQSFDSPSNQGFTTADWTTGEYVNNSGSGEITFIDAPTIINFLNTIDTSRIFYQVNGGNLLPSAGWGSGGNNITFYTSIPPATSPETVTTFSISYSDRSLIEMDYDEAAMNILSRGLDINITSDQSIDVITSDIIRLQNSSNSSGVGIITDSSNAFHTWNFLPTGNLTLPTNGSIIVDGGDGAIGPVSDDLVISWNNEDLRLVSVNDSIIMQSNAAFRVQTNYDGGNVLYASRWEFNQNEIVNITNNFGIVSEAGNLNLSGGRDGVNSGNTTISAVDTGVAVSTWTFDNTGVMTLPNGGQVDNSDNNIELRSTNNINFESNAVVNIYTDSSIDAYQWQFDDAGALILAPILTGEGTGESAAIRGSRTIVGGFDNPLPYVVEIPGHTEFGNVVWTASSGSIQSAKITFVVQGGGQNYQWEQFDVSVAKTGSGNAFVTVSNRIKYNNSVADTQVEAYDGEGGLEVWLNPADGQTVAWVNYQAVEFGLMVD